jgi:hypothetical protein
MSNSGMAMMLKSFGLDPKMFEQVGAAVKTVVETMQAIKKQNEEIISRLDELKNGTLGRREETVRSSQGERGGPGGDSAQKESSLVG